MVTLRTERGQVQGVSVAGSRGTPAAAAPWEGETQTFSTDSLRALESRLQDSEDAEICGTYAQLRTRSLLTEHTCLRLCKGGTHGLWGVGVGVVVP